MLSNTNTASTEDSAKCAETQATLRQRRLSARSHVEELCENARQIQEDEEQEHVMACAQAVKPQIGIPALGKDNHAVWKYTVLAFAAENELTEHLQGNVPILQAAGALPPVIKKRAQAGRLIISTIGTTLLM